MSKESEPSFEACENAAGATTAVDGGELRKVDGLRITPFDIPAGCVGGYYPECNPLVPLAHHAEQSKVPASKMIPVRLALMAEAARA